MALPVLTPGRRRRSRRPLVVALVLLAALGLAAVQQARSRGHGHPASRTETHAARKTQPRHARVKHTKPRRTRPHAELASLRAPLLVGAGTRHTHHFAPRLGARGAILVNEATGAVLWAYDPYRRLPIASTTKIMTAVIALQRLRPNTVVTVSKLVPRVPLVREGLRAGERVPVRKLLYALLLYSGNDDALALAQATAGSRPAFLRLMNQQAKALGLRSTHFTSPSGVIDRGNYSTAWDLASLARYALRDDRFRKIVRTRIKRVPWPPPTFSKIYVNKNALLATYQGADGVKTGWTTKARHCLVASAHRRGIHLLAVVLGSWDAFTDARRLLNYGFRVNGR
jgi:serine-type D-Ala-D-Ala carboxypeptidase (penicillin-binding protein 5/6)